MNLVIAALVSWLLVGVFQAVARQRGWGQRVRVDGVQKHLVKDGIPTMGGVPFVIAILAVWFLLSGGSLPPGELAVVALAFAMALIGLIDDILLVRSRMAGLPRGGLKAREKMPLQVLVALAFAIAVSREVSLTGATWLDVTLFTLAVVGSVNAVNFTDGLDGLAAGVVAIALVPLAAASPLAAVTIGALLGYLWFNSRPASIFMGDAGSHALGAILAGVFITQGWTWVLPIAGIIPVLEIISVVAQVAWFRRTGGQRLLRMAPLHHHFELVGWQEGKVTGRFMVLTALGAAVAWSLMAGQA